MSFVRAVKDKYGVKLKYPERECKQCKNYPCFSGITECRSDFAKYGCNLYVENGKV